MIIIRISGGLGNQLFQYAYGRALTLKHHDTLQLDISSLASGERSYSLGVFAINATLAQPEGYDVIGIPNPAHTGLFQKSIRKIIEFIDRRLPNAERKIVREIGFNFNQDLMSVHGNHYLIGLWQSEKYFKPFRTELLQDLQLRNPLSKTASEIQKTIQSSQAVSVHIRRGDYVTNPHTNQKHGTCTPEYYSKAIDYIQSKVPNPHFYVFSDDITWVKAHISMPSATTYVSDKGLPHYEELMLMSFCKHNIIANSSFSWWGAWLNQHSNKTVIAPKTWFLTNVDTKDLIPADWIRV